MKATQIILLFITILLCSCSEAIKKQNFSSFLNEPCIILNFQQDNTIEGDYLIVEKNNFKDSTIRVKLPPDFFVNESNISNWILGWGSEEPLFDAGCENLCVIKKINNGIITLGKVLRGSGFPKNSQRIVFWNKNPSGFVNEVKQPIISSSMWPEFAGNSIAFSSIEYDVILKKWVMILHECDTTKIQIYAAISDDLINWVAANNGEPILRATDFENCKWAGKDNTNSHPQTAFVSDIVRFKNKWHLFLDGYSSDGKRHIGLAVSEGSLLGPYKILENPILSPDVEGSWNEHYCFYPKIEEYNNGFIMFYDGRNKNGLERIGMATSKDLITWENSSHNPVIDQHTGWRSSINATEPNYIEVRKDTILIIIAGAKKFKMGPWHHYITKRMYLDVSGNVNDAQLGTYLSTDKGETFIAHKNNPIYTNDYSNVYENEHMGGNFKLIKTDSVDYIFYQAKSSFEGLKYNIMLRQRKNNILL